MSLHWLARQATPYNDVLFRALHEDGRFDLCVHYLRGSTRTHPCFRRGFFGVSDVSPWLSLGIVGGSFVLVSALALRLLKSGYKLRH